jgi:two-component sensor histidine kinase
MATVLPVAACAIILLPAGGSEGGVPSAVTLPVLLAAAALAGLQVVRMRGLLRRSRDEAARLRAQLEEERAMLREMQHRIANALQFLASLLSLQAGRVTDPDAAREALEDAAARLGTVARIHRRLTEPNLSGDALPELLQDIANAMLAARGLGPAVSDNVRLRVHVADAARRLDPVRATAVAMIVAEAATNAAKHAFDARDAGSLDIVLERRDAQFVLSITDDGPGPPEDAALQESLGLPVMQAMARRLAGEFHFGRGAQGGAQVLVTFPAQADTPPAHTAAR